MAFDRDLADRIHAVLSDVPDLTGKPLFGGYGVFRRGVMFAGVFRAQLMVKLREGAADAMLEPHTSGFDPMGKGTPMTGWVMVDAVATGTDEELRDWLDRALAAIPPGATKSKPKKRKK